MVHDPDNFELDFDQGKVRVTRHTIGSHVIFRVTYPGKRLPLVLTRVLQPNGTNSGHQYLKEDKEKQKKRVL